MCSMICFSFLFFFFKLILIKDSCCLEEYFERISQHPQEIIGVSPGNHQAQAGNDGVNHLSANSSFN